MNEATEATRAALLEAGRELFAARGYTDVSTDEIVHAARVSRGSLYHHFNDKRDLFRAVFEQVDHELVTKLTVCTARSPTQASRKFCQRPLKRSHGSSLWSPSRVRESRRRRARGSRTR